MEINELNKKQLVLLTLLITFVVSIATGIVTVSLMQQAPKSVPQTVNNIIQRTIEKVTTVQVPVAVEDSKKQKANLFFVNNEEALISIYPIIGSEIILETESSGEVLNQNDLSKENLETKKEDSLALGQGIIISEAGLILVESSILQNYQKYKVLLDKKDFEVSVLKKFNNGFTILKIVTKQDPKNN